jgi:NADH-quinone oxidoreductase E subunit
MTGKVHFKENNGPSVFAFTTENFRHAQQIIGRYPEGKVQSALLPLLTLAQKQNGGWLPKSAMDYIAMMLALPPVRVYEVATFYTMYNLEPVGRYMIEVCTTTPCWLRGSDAIVEACERHLGIKVGETTVDGHFTLREAECLGACVNAPMCQVGDYYFEDLTPQSVVKIIDGLANGESLQAGPQNGRKSSEPLSRETPKSVESK